MATTTAAEIRQLPVRLPVDDYRALKGYAFFTDTSMNDVIVKAVQAFITEHREHFEAMLAQARTDYRVTLDKLRDQ